VSRAPIGVAVGFGVGIAVHLASRPPESGQFLRSITPTKYPVLLIPEDSA
jgi:hypothetical protein